MEDEIMTREEVAKFIKVSLSTVSRLMARGEIPAVRYGRRFTRFRKSDILAFLERHMDIKSGREVKNNEGRTLRQGIERGTGRGV